MENQGNIKPQKTINKPDAPEQKRIVPYSNAEILKAVIEILYDLTVTGESVPITPLNLAATFSPTFKYGDFVNTASLLKAFKHYTGKNKPAFMK